MGSKNKKKNRNNPSAEKDTKVSDVGGDGGKLVTDERFSRVHWDPRFRPLPKHKNKVELDPRFKSMFSDKRFSSSAALLDKRGRPKKHNKQNPLHRYYRIEENKDKEDETDEDEVEEKEEVEGVKEEETGSEEEELERNAAALKTAQLSDESEESEPASSSEVETADTESTIDTDEDDEDHVYEEEEVQEQEENIPNIDKETHRLAVCNMDWRHVKAVDLFVVLSSFLPNNGRILSVTVYPSEFGLQRMKEEEVHGPVGLFDGEKDEDEKEHEENDENIDKEKLRIYEKSRLRYFYAVVECDSVSTADYLYTVCDGTEFERSSNVLDLRFIPDSMEFKHPPRDVATEAPANYDGLDFQTRCLQQSNIELTWDEDEPERVKTLKQKFNAEQLADMELRDYLASDESDSDDEEENKDSNNKEEKDKKRNKYLSLLGDGSDGGSGEDDDEKQDMEVTFNPGLEDLSKRILEKKEAQSETVFESFLRKRKEKKMMRKNKSKSAALSDDNSSDADEKETKEDDFFIEEEEAEVPVKKGSKDRHGKDKIKNEKRESADWEKEATAAELELLFADETGGAGNDGPKGYNIKRKNAKGKKKKTGKENSDDDVDELAKLPTLDEVDSRFSGIFTSEFALDPTDPNYKRSATYLRQAASKRKQQKGDDNNEPPRENHPLVNNKSEEATSNSKREKHELSSLVKSLKMKSKQVVPLPNKEEDGSMARRHNNKKRNMEQEKKMEKKKKIEG